MASLLNMQVAVFSTSSIKQSIPSLNTSNNSKCCTFYGSKLTPQGTPTLKTNQKRSLTVVAAYGDVSSNGTTYLIIGACTVALLGTAFPVLFSRKDLCPECDGAGFVRKSGSTLKANAARKDELQIVCARCNGLGKLNQIDKSK